MNTSARVGFTLRQVSIFFPDWVWFAQCRATTAEDFNAAFCEALP
jgi:hypothetical protein